MDPGVQGSTMNDRKAEVVTALYRYSDLSVEAIADQVDADIGWVQGVVDGLVKDEALRLWLDQCTAKIEQVMTGNVVTLDVSKTALDAAVLMAEKKIGCIVVTKADEPFGIVTERDIIRRAAATGVLLKDIKLADIASQPLVVGRPDMNVEDVTEIMAENKIRRLPIVSQNRVVGIVTASDLAAFLAPSRRKGFALSVLKAVTRSRV